MIPDTLPDRPLGARAALVRAQVRRLRMLRLRARLGKRLVSGHNVYFGPHAFVAPPDFIKLAGDIAVGANFHLETNLVVGEGVLISSNVSIVGNDHAIDDPTTNVYWSGRSRASTVSLEGDNLIGFGTIIVGDVHIGRGCIVGAGSIVTKDLPADTVCHGAPARPHRSRFDSAHASGREA